jgi:tetratricopeptide (TPR) repeat protein
MKSSICPSSPAAGLRRAAAFLLAIAPMLGADAGLIKARDAQDQTALQRIASQAAARADKEASDAGAQYNAAMTESTLAEVAMEIRDKSLARTASEAGMRTAERATMLKPDVAEYHRIFGTLCGQAAAATGGLGALKYGRCALDEVNKAVQLDAKAPMNYLSRGIGNYYLPAALGGGVELAVKDFERAAELDGNLADAHLWMGLALRKLNRNAEARKEFRKAVDLDPARAWARQQLEKTPE